MIYKEYLYGAYGSNLNLNQMVRRCPNAQPVGSVVLIGMQLAFRGVADVEHKQGAQVALGLWKITQACEAQLDIYEGYPRLYGKDFIKIKGLQESLGTNEVLIYTMNSTDIYPPASSYLQSISQGYKDFGLDTEGLYSAVKESYARESI